MTGTREYEVGKGKPPKQHQFKPGNKAGIGKTSEQKTLELRNAEAAMRIRERILRAAEARLVECSTDDVLEQFVDAAMLKLLKDSEDRGLGSPIQPVDHSSADGSMSPKPGLDVSKLSEAAMAEIMRAADASKPSDD